jgi:hypothetical protein
VGLCKKSRGREIEGFLFCFVLCFFLGGGMFEFDQEF